MLKGSSVAEQIRNYFLDKGLSKYGVYGLMGNLKAESGLNPKNLQNTYNKKLSLTDEEYTSQVDNGIYTNFVRDSAGYGLAQWTYWSRKQNMLNFMKSKKKSIGDLEGQLDFLYKELSEGYKGVLQALKTATSIREASDVVLLQFERPANQGESVQKTRASYGQEFYDQLENNVKGGNATMSNSGLVTCTVKSPNHSGARTHSIDRITPHCVVGQLSASGIGGCFTSTSRQASCNYGIGTEGGVCLIVDEANRSWCSSSNANDQRAVTIECASDRTEPYAFNSTVYNKLIDLCVDICKRNGKKKLLWISDKAQALAYNPKSDEMLLTVHRWFANKSCPGDWMYSRMGDLANKVTSRLGGSGGSSQPVKPTSSGTNTSFPVVPFSVKVIVSDLNIRTAAGMSGNVVGQTGKGSFTITEVKDGWGKLKSGAGWIYLENKSYVTIGSSQKTNNTSSAYQVKITADVLNVRAGAGVGHKINTTVKKNEVYTIVSESNGWGKLKSGAGWISLEYTKRV